MSDAVIIYPAKTEWTVYVDGRHPELDKIVRRRGGPGWDYACADPAMGTCAVWACQVKGRCRHQDRGI